MLDHECVPQQIQFICHDPLCFLAHQKKRKHCVACNALRVVEKEPTIYDPIIHRAFIVKAPPLSTPLGAAAKAKAASPGPPASAETDPLDIDAEAEPFLEVAIDDDAMGEGHDGEADSLGDWHPACLTKAAVRLCIQEEVNEAIQYKRLFDLKDMAESELTQRLQLEKRKLTVMEMDTTGFMKKKLRMPSSA